MKPESLCCRPVKAAMLAALVSSTASAATPLTLILPSFIVQNKNLVFSHMRKKYSYHILCNISHSTAMCTVEPYCACTNTLMIKCPFFFFNKARKLHFAYVRKRAVLYEREQQRSTLLFCQQ
jgi:hypothetical protein